MRLRCTKSLALHTHQVPRGLPKRSSCHGDSFTRSTLGPSHSRTLRPSDVFYCTTSHAHFGSKSIPYHAAMAGGQVVIRSRFALNSFWQDVSEFGITTGMLVGSMADLLLRAPESPSGSNVAQESIHGSARRLL